MCPSPGHQGVQMSSVLVTFQPSESLMASELVTFSFQASQSHWSILSLSPSRSQRSLIPTILFTFHSTRVMLSILSSSWHQGLLRPPVPSIPGSHPWILCILDLKVTQTVYAFWIYHLLGNRGYVCSAILHAVFVTNASWTRQLSAKEGYWLYLLSFKQHVHFHAPNVPHSSSVLVVFQAIRIICALLSCLCHQVTEVW